jgi:DNA-binding CsgD family transcriptional regulator
LACGGRIAEAEETLETLTEISTHPDASGLSVTARAVIAAHRKDFLLVTDELLRLRRLDILDPLVVAERGSPELSAAIKDLDDPRVIRLLPQGLGPKAKDETVLNSLTARELEVLQLLARGRTNREIAGELVIAEVTAKVHVRHILRKLGRRSRTEAAVLTTTLARAGGTVGQAGA